MRGRGLSVVVWCAVTATLVAGLPAGQVQAAARVATTDTAGQRPVTITLITGDRVTVDIGDRLTVTPGSGRKGVTFLHQQIKGHRYVIPADAVPLLNADRLDRRLFDVTAMREFGYDDRARELPLLVAAKGARSAGPQQRSAARSAAGAAVAVAGVRVTRDLPVADAVAVRADRAGRVALWGSLTGGASGKRSLPAAVGKVWLDGKRTVDLDVSVPQIGAPAAWKAGFDGKGVKVAVLDTGIDATHPDLAGRIGASANFTDAPNVDDTVGHGTHVASTIAGSGAASGGRYRGVAPGATLLIGKVCGDRGCADSSILAGMQWAAQQGARVVNMSLGGSDAPDVDPLEQAVDDLTVSSGALFVISAGNSGGNATVGSPASADAALAVGAVDSKDRLAGFSSRGPRIGDDGLKPDITAPGVDIVAAKAAHGVIGGPAPVAGYTTLSGTSMAAPHVAGAAAILTQEHPGWSPALRKSTLMGSAKPTAGLGVFGQGAGRVDVARAIVQSVTLDTPSIGLGRQVWPHGDDPKIARTLTYRNSGTAAVTLALAVTATDPTGKAAPAGMFTVGATSLTVPVGGTATVPFTADTRVDGPDGYYGGYLTATAAGGVQVQTAFAVNREKESYDLTLVHTGRDGTPATDYQTLLFNVDTGEIIGVDASDTGSATIRVPKGRYGVVSWLFDGFSDDEPSNDAVTLLTQPQAIVDAAASLPIDARRGRPVTVTVPRADARPAGFAVTADWLLGGDREFRSGLTAPGLEGQFFAQIAPAPDLDGFTSAISATFARPAEDGTFFNSPYTYDLAWYHKGGMPTAFRRNVKDEDLATINARYAEQAEGELGVRYAFGLTPDGAMTLGTNTVDFALPFRRTEYVNTDGGLTWDTPFTEINGEDGSDLANVRNVARYRPRHSYDVRWNTAVFGPSVTTTPSGSPTPWVNRLGDTLIAAVPLFGDGQGHAGGAVTTAARTAVYRNGTLVGEVAAPFGEFVVPAAQGAYRIEQSAERGAPNALSTKVQASWTFTSGHVSGDVPALLPVSVVRFTPQLNDRNTAPAGRAFSIGVNVDRLAGSAAAANRTLSVQVSYDDGRTWRDAPVQAKGADRVAVVQHPGAAGFASLRATATDTAGNTVTQTVIRAYRIG